MLAAVDDRQRPLTPIAQRCYYSLSRSSPSTPSPTLATDCSALLMHALENTSHNPPVRPPRPLCCPFPGFWYPSYAPLIHNSPSALARCTPFTLVRPRLFHLPRPGTRTRPRRDMSLWRPPSSLQRALSSRLPPPNHSFASAVTPPPAPVTCCHLQHATCNLQLQHRLRIQTLPTTLLRSRSRSPSLPLALSTLHS